MLSDSGGAICRRCSCLVAPLFVTVGHHYNGKHGLDVTEVALLVAHCKTALLRISRFEIVFKAFAWLRRPLVHLNEFEDQTCRFDQKISVDEVDHR